LVTSYDENWSESETYSDQFSQENDEISSESDKNLSCSDEIWSETGKKFYRIQMKFDLKPTKFRRLQMKFPKQFLAIKPATTSSWERSKFDSGPLW